LFHYSNPVNNSSNSFSVYFIIDQISTSVLWPQQNTFFFLFYFNFLKHIHLLCHYQSELYKTSWTVPESYKVYNVIYLHYMFMLQYTLILKAGYYKLRLWLHTTVVCLTTSLLHRSRYSSNMTQSSWLKDKDSTSTNNFVKSNYIMHYNVLLIWMWNAFTTQINLQTYSVP
jgi:hypothetical protein